MRICNVVECKHHTKDDHCTKGLLTMKRIVIDGVIYSVCLQFYRKQKYKDHTESNLFINPMPFEDTLDAHESKERVKKWPEPMKSAYGKFKNQYVEEDQS